MESVERWMNWAKQKKESKHLWLKGIIEIELAQIEKERKEPEYTFIPNT